VPAEEVTMNDRILATTTDLVFAPAALRQVPFPNGKRPAVDAHAGDGGGDVNPVEPVRQRAGQVLLRALDAVLSDLAEAVPDMEECVASLEARKPDHIELRLVPEGSDEFNNLLRAALGKTHEILRAAKAIKATARTVREDLMVRPPAA
jgi:hypothetical protein